MAGKDALRYAMVLAAGLGQRMRPLTDERPKPLILVNGKPLIDYALDCLADAGVRKAVVNVHYKAELLEAHLASCKRPEIIISDERAMLMDTGGALMKARTHFPDAPIFYTNTDSIILSGSVNPLLRMKAAWRDAEKDVLLLLTTHTKARGYSGRGDFHLDPFGKIRRRGERECAPFIWTGAAVIHPRTLASCPATPFSTNLIIDEAIARGRAFGLRHDGAWLHVGTPEAVKTAERLLNDGAQQQRTPPV
ncbi:MAG: nucleotidyltransferase family protein [Parvularculaceae bacterium]